MGDDNKIYVGGLAPETTVDSLRLHFMQYGDIVDCVVMTDKVTGRSRCFGFVTYADASGMNAALGTSTVVDGREVACKKAVRESPSMAAQVVTDGFYNVVKLFVGGLPATCDHQKFVAYFERFGIIEDAVVMMDNATQRHRGFGYVTFSDPAAVDAAIQNYAGNQIDGKWIEVKRCIPQDKMAPGGTGKGGKGKGFGFGKGHYANGGKGGCGVVPPRVVSPPMVGVQRPAPMLESSPFVPFDGPCAGSGGYSAAFSPSPLPPRPQFQPGAAARGAAGAMLAAANAAMALATASAGAAQGVYSAAPQTRFADPRVGPY